MEQQTGIGRGCMNFLLDTNACLDFLLARSASLAARVEREFSRLAVSAITAAELRVGNRNSEHPEEDARRVDLFLTTIVAHDFDAAAATAYGEIARQIGFKRSSFDRLIAAHALSLGLILVTRNADDFSDVPGLKLENWTL
ncbi:type II toxin-antitoxin system VapC family toxin [Sphingomonas sp. MMS12-HWE2-04]|uniref:type II toxin-antitoxin system VapC family toxin n=1 Tax=Sphingomonas sp. MMS12-HWE2-04 TaxID=3234199 RepID=UPI00384F4E5C